MRILEPGCAFREAYAAWAPYYPPFAHNALMQVEERAVLMLLPPVTGLTALDAACGTGRYMRVLEERGARHVFGVDNSPAMAAQAGRPIVLGDFAALPFGTGSVDVIVSGLAMNDVADLDSVIRELASVLKPGGTLVYSLLHPRGAELMWTRTFEAAGRTWSLPAYWHTAADQDRACAAAGLHIDARREPEIPGRGPVALVIRARRT